MTNQDQTIATGQVILTQEFLTAPLKGVELTADHHTTALHIKGLTTKNTFERLFEINYKNEIKRLAVNQASVESKRKKAAEKAGLTMEQYLEQLGTSNGGGRKTEYKFTEEQYSQCKDMLKIIKTLPVEDQCLWLEIEQEKKRFKANQASKKSNEKKKIVIVDAEIVDVEGIVDVEIADAE